MTTRVAVGAAEMLVDDEDVVRVLAFPLWIGKKPESGRSGWHRYVAGKINGRSVPIHRFIINAPDGALVDHINGDPLDNRKANLRLCTHAENMRNRKMHANNKSGHRGVCWHKGEGRWRAAIKVDGRTKYLGTFESVEAAAAAYQAAQRERAA